MPLYDIQCKAGHRSERHIKIENFSDPIICDCGEVASRCISAPRIVWGGIDYSYDCPVTGKHITTKHAHEENLKRHGCRVLEGGEREYNQRQRAAEEAAFDRKVEESVERQIETMPSEKREQLAKELSTGVDAVIERK
jgi:hypothetical protein